ncbi:MAG: glutamate 5-kinase [Candidatus Methylopumilus sp.]|nr:glutamate 5-kinase [Candidatus Methylopumilus sp.]
MKSLLANSQRIIIKVGSSLVTNLGAGLDQKAIASWAEQIAHLIKEGKEIVLVSSGAVAEGMQRLGWKARPTLINELQAAAAIGQMGLMQIYEKNFSQHALKAAQILLTHDDLADRKRYLNARSTLNTLLDLKVIPIINENDTVVTDEIRFGDNDTLASLVANLIEADLLIILTDQPGLFSEDPRKNANAKLIHQGEAGDLSLEAMAGDVGSLIGTGGMLTKVLAAKRAARSGAHTIIASGKEDNILIRLNQGELIGTHLESKQLKVAARKQWLADHLQLRGKLVLDDGAVIALEKEGKSLLPIGVKLIEGEFDRGEVVLCVDTKGREIARGLINYNANETKKIIGKPTNSIESLLGYIDQPSLIHRDNLILL